MIESCTLEKIIQTWDVANEKSQVIAEAEIERMYGLSAVPLKIEMNGRKLVQLKKELKKIRAKPLYFVVQNKWFQAHASNILITFRAEDVEKCPMFFGQQTSVISTSPSKEEKRDINEHIILQASSSSSSSRWRWVKRVICGATIGLIVGGAIFISTM